MKKQLFFSFLMLGILLLTGCSSQPGDALKNEQYEIVNKNAKQSLGNDCEASGFAVSKEGYSNQEKTEFKVSFTFDLNKKAVNSKGKKIPAELTFTKETSGWKCSYNSTNNSEFFAPESSIIDKALDIFGSIVKKKLNITDLTDDEENEIGAELEKRIAKEHKPGNSTKFDVASVFNKVKANVSRKNIKYRYEIIENEEVNAFTITGGKVYINTGLLNFLANEDELAFVIAHEISHNEKKHCAKTIQLAVRAGQINPLLGDVVAIAYRIYHKPFSKYDEYEADDNGVSLMTTAGFNKAGALSSFDRLAELEKKYGQDKKSPLNDFISSHPTAIDRKNRILKK